MDEINEKNKEILEKLKMLKKMKSFGKVGKASVGNAIGNTSYRASNYNTGVFMSNYPGSQDYGSGSSHGADSYGGSVANYRGGRLSRRGNKTWTRNTSIAKHVDTNPSITSNLTLQTDHDMENLSGHSELREDPRESGNSSSQFNFIIKANNKKLVRIGAPPIVSSRNKIIGKCGDLLEKIPTKNVDQIMKKYSITQHAANSISSDYITIKNKLVRKSILPQGIEKQSSKDDLLSLRRKDEKTKYCRHFAKGHCVDDNCKFIHDKERLMVCRQLLQHGICKDEQKVNNPCSFNHFPTPRNTPLCFYFLKGKCTVNDCRYNHNPNIDQKSPICTDFAIMNYCALGEICDKKHLNLCPDYYESGDCTRGSRCRLKHIFSKDENDTNNHDIYLNELIFNEKRQKNVNDENVNDASMDEYDNLDSPWKSNQDSKTLEETDFIAFE